MNDEVTTQRSLACPACSAGSTFPPLLQRNEENKSYYCSCCGIEWGILIFDTDAAEVIATMPFILDQVVNQVEA